MSDLERWQQAVAEVTKQLLEYPNRSENPWLKNFPRASCSVTSYAVGRLLLERYGEQWLLVSRSGYRGASHTWLVRDRGAGPSAAIDATLHQFTDITSETFVGWGMSPADELFPYRAGQTVYVGLVESGWHHGQTNEIYEWLFPRLGLNTFEPNESLRHLMPDDLAYPPVTRLVDVMLAESERCHPDVTYVIVLGPQTSDVLRRNSDAALGRHRAERAEYLGRIILSVEQAVEDTAILLPDPTEHPSDDAICFVGLVSNGQFRAVLPSELDEFDLSSLRPLDSGHHGSVSR